MYSYEYPRPSVTADILIVDKHWRQLLLIERRNEPYRHCWALPGGFFDMDDEDVEATAYRELQEETGIMGVELRELFVASRKGRDPRGRTISVVFEGEADSETVDAQGGDDALRVRWFSYDNLPPLAFDHEEIIAKALGIGK